MPHDFDKNDASDHDAKRARRTAKALRDILRKTIAQSGDARHNTEELLRAVLGEVKIPREYVNLILQQINATRGELLSVVAGEVRTFLADANLGEELAKILTSLSFEIRTEIRFIPNEDVLRPSVKSRVGVKSARPRTKAPAEPHTEPDTETEDDAFVETRGSAAIDKAIQSRVTSLANMFLKGFIEVDDESHEDSDEDDKEERTDAPTVDHVKSESSQSPVESNDAPIGAPEDSDEDDEEQRRAGFSPRDLRLRMPLGPDFRRRAEAAASQVATASRATAASAVSAAATRAQAVVRGGRALTTPDAREVMWKRWVSPEEPDLVGNPVIGARVDYVRPKDPVIDRPPGEATPAILPTDVASEIDPAPTSKGAEDAQGAAKHEEDSASADAAVHADAVSDDEAPPTADASKGAAPKEKTAKTQKTPTTGVTSTSKVDEEREAKDAEQEQPSEVETVTAQDRDTPTTTASVAASAEDKSTEAKKTTPVSSSTKRASKSASSKTAKKQKTSATVSKTSAKKDPPDKKQAPVDETTPDESTTPTSASKPKARSAATPQPSDPADESTAGDD